MRVAFLDRDGTINVDVGYLSQVDDWRLCDGAGDALIKLAELGFRLAVVTNQSGVARGLISPSELTRIHERMHDDLANHGVELHALAVCPHSPADNCECRKPKTGLVNSVEQQLGASIDFGRSWMIGDKPTDVEFGNALGTRTALLQSSYWDAEQLGCRPDLVVRDLATCVSEIQTF